MSAEHPTPPLIDGHIYHRQDRYYPRDNGTYRYDAATNTMMSIESFWSGRLTGDRWSAGDGFGTYAEGEENPEIWTDVTDSEEAKATQTPTTCQVQGVTLVASQPEKPGFCFGCYLYGNNLYESCRDARPADYSPANDMAYCIAAKIIWIEKEGQ